MFYKKGGGDIWSILTLNNVFFLGKMEKTRVAEGGFTYSHNIISIYHPKWWFFGEDQKCSWGPKMKNKPNFFFDNRGFPNWGVGVGGSAAWELFPHNPVFLSENVPNSQKIPMPRLTTWQLADNRQCPVKIYKAVQMIHICLCGQAYGLLYHCISSEVRIGGHIFIIMDNNVDQPASRNTWWLGKNSTQLM